VKPPRLKNDVNSMTIAKIEIRSIFALIGCAYYLKLRTLRNMASLYHSVFISTLANDLKTESLVKL